MTKIAIVCSSGHGHTRIIAENIGGRHTAERFGRRIARTTSRWMMGAQTYPAQPISESEAGQRNVAGPDEWRKFDDQAPKTHAGHRLLNAFLPNPHRNVR